MEERRVYIEFADGGKLQSDVAFELIAITMWSSNENIPMVGEKEKSESAESE